MAHDTFTYLYETQDPTRLALVRAALKEAGVRLRVRNEHTMQLAGAWAMGQEGAVIEVLDDDFVAAAAVLKDFDVRVDYDRRRDRFPGVDAFEGLTDRIPIFRSFELVQRIVVAGVCLCGLALAGLLNLIIRPSPAEVFDGRSWYVGSVGGAALAPFRTGAYARLTVDERRPRRWTGQVRTSDPSGGGGESRGFAFYPARDELRLATATGDSLVLDVRRSLIGSVRLASPTAGSVRLSR